MQRPSSNPSGFLRPSLRDLALEPWERGSDSVQAHPGLLARGLGSCGREELGGKVRKPLGSGDERLGIEVYLAHLGPDSPQPHIKPELLGTPGALTLAAGDFAGLPAGFRASQPCTAPLDGRALAGRRDQELGTPRSLLQGTGFSAPRLSFSSILVAALRSRWQVTSRIDLEAPSSICFSWPWRPPAPTLAAPGPRPGKSSRGGAVNAPRSGLPGPAAWGRGPLGRGLLRRILAEFFFLPSRV